ncbi:pumilio homolog 24-like [Olea europaea var. sylvestris]|uniref:pumilio homolog 24-like n=1 Tax=Olea europaea var. sylvestris TaxID=158386 RepID=UPI000C1D476A|nr:pumilio homolog 24-like [Olea europaea var. sylvestris]
MAAKPEKKRKSAPGSKSEAGKSHPKKPKVIGSNILNKVSKKPLKSPGKEHIHHSGKPKVQKGDVDDKKLRRLQAKELAEARKKKRKRHYTLEQELTSLWEKMRVRDIKKEDRSKHVSEALEKMKGKIREIASSHVSSRVLQTCVKHCTQDERNAVFTELRPHFISLVSNTYAVHLVTKMLDNASKEQLAEFISSLHGHVASLLRQMVGSLVIEHAYSLGSATQKQALLMELYSPELQLFKDLVTMKETRYIIYYSSCVSLAVQPKLDNAEEEHILEQFHSSRTIRKLVLDCPAFASTLWEKALKGKCATWVEGHSSKIINAYLETSDSKIKELAKEELQPFVDSGLLRLPVTVSTQSNEFFWLHEFWDDGSFIRLYGKQAVYRSDRVATAISRELLFSRFPLGAAIFHLESIAMLLLLIDACHEMAGELLRSKFGKEIIYEVAVGGADGILHPILDEKLSFLHEAIVSLAVQPKLDNAEEEHILEQFHSSRTIRKLVLDCPAFASTLWEKALKGKCATWVEGHSSKIINAYLETSDSKIKELAKEELQPFVDSGLLRLPVTGDSVKND